MYINKFKFLNPDYKEPTIAKIKIKKNINLYDAQHFAKSMFMGIDNVGKSCINYIEEDEYYVFFAFDGYTNFDENKFYEGLNFIMYFK
jgi:hypothetical protein